MSRKDERNCFLFSALYSLLLWLHHHKIIKDYIHTGGVK